MADKCVSAPACPPASAAQHRRYNALPRPACFDVSPPLFSHRCRKEVLSTLSTDNGKVFSALHGLEPRGSLDLMTGLQIAQVCGSDVNPFFVLARSPLCSAPFFLLLPGPFPMTPAHDRLNATAACAEAP